MIKFAPEKNLTIALGAAVLCIMASALMNFTESKIIRVILRQVLQVIGISLIKLFIVGLVFISIIRIANHWLIAFPFWWIGGIFDVMFGSEATASVDWGGFTIYSVIILAMIIGLFIWKQHHGAEPYI